MSTSKTVHLIDPDSSRRAALAFGLVKNKTHAEIYEGVWEFVQADPKKGVVIAFDDSEAGGASEVLEFVARRGRFVPVTMYAQEPSAERVVMAMKMGAFSYLSWPISEIRLSSTVRQMFTKGEEGLAYLKVLHEAKNCVSKLSPREHEILVLLIEGLSNKAIALRLGISPRTVEIHRGNMMTKLSARSTAEAVRIGLYAGLDKIDLLQSAA